jgi:hypothetical protein
MHRDCAGTPAWTDKQQLEHSCEGGLNTNDASYCLSQNPTPEPKLSPGPSGVSAELTSARRMGMFKAFLAIPSVRYDARTNVSSMDERETEILGSPYVEENARRCGSFSSCIERTQKSWTAWPSGMDSNCRYRFLNCQTTAIGRFAT